MSAHRNFSWDSFGKDVLQGVHNYVGKPVLKFYLGDTGGKVADTLGENEDKWIGRDKKKQPEKKPAPPAAGAQRPSEPPKQQPQQQQQQPAAQQQAQPAGGFDFTRLFGKTGADQKQSSPVGGGGKDGQKEKVPRGAGLAAFDGTAAAARAARAGREATAEGSDRDPHDAREAAQRFWRSLGR